MYSHATIEWDKNTNESYKIMHSQHLDDDHTICYHSKFIQSKEFSHKLPLFDDGKFLARCVILPLSLCILSAFLPLCQHQKEEETGLSRQHVVAGHGKKN
jgi:hypothetical protein